MYSEPVDKPPDTIAGRLGLVMQNLGIGERELARRAGLASEAHVGLMLRRLREEPGAVLVGTLDKVARGAGVSLAWLVTGEEAGRPVLDPAPARTAAAKVAASRGIWPEAVRSVLADEVSEQDRARTGTWWLSRMMQREEEMIDEALRRRAAQEAPRSEPFFPPDQPGEERAPPSESHEARVHRRKKTARK